jgi:signal transduction histidine kinase
LYTGLFLLSGTALLIGVYVLVSRSTAIAVSAQPVRGAGSALIVPDPGGPIRNGVVAQRAADLGNLLTVSWLVLAVSALASAILGWFAAGRVLRPLRAITETAQTISAGSLHQRLALTGPDDEFKRLGDTLDDLFGRLEASFEAQRRFVANASHELRTPLTVERTLLQVALADPSASAEALRSACEGALTVGVEHERLLEALLTLASSDRGIDRREPIDLASCAEHALEASRSAIDRHSLQVETSLGPAHTAGDPALVARLVANLIDNAASHNVPGGRIEVKTDTDANLAVVRVANSGEVIAPADVDRLFEPFHRHGQTRGVEDDGHFGLGLSIVRAIARAHGADVSAAGQAGGGLAISVSFPAPRT